jgi:hypothetical protein
MVTNVRIQPDPDQIRNTGKEVKVSLETSKKIVLAKWPYIFGYDLRFIHEVKNLFHKIAFMETKKTQEFYIENIV